MTYASVQELRKSVDNMIQEDLEYRHAKPIPINRMISLKRIMREFLIQGLNTTERVVFYEFCKVRMGELMDEERDTDFAQF